MFFHLILFSLAAACINVSLEAQYKYKNDNMAKMAYLVLNQKQDLLNYFCSQNQLLTRSVGYNYSYGQNVLNLSHALLIDSNLAEHILA